MFFYFSLLMSIVTLHQLNVIMPFSARRASSIRICFPTKIAEVTSCLLLSEPEFLFSANSFYLISALYFEIRMKSYMQHFLWFSWMFSWQPTFLSSVQSFETFLLYIKIPLSHHFPMKMLTLKILTATIHSCLVHRHDYACLHYMHS